MNNDAHVPLATGRLFGLLVTFNRPNALAEHLAVLSRQTRRLDRLIVVNNGDQDGVEEVVATSGAAEHATEVIHTGENLGPAGAIQVGMEHLLTQGEAADWIVLLDDDDPPRRDDLLQRLFDFARAQRKSDRSVGVVGQSGTRFDRRRGRVQRLADSALKGAIDVDYVGGNQVPVVNVGTIRDAGSFRGELFFGFDDLEFGLRVKDAGWRILLDGDLAWWARETAGRLGPGFGTVSAIRAGVPWRRYYSVRNLIAIERWHGTLPGAIRVSVVAGLAKPILMCIRSPRVGWQHLALGIRAVIDAWSGRLGRRLEPPA